MTKTVFSTDERGEKTVNKTVVFYDRENNDLRVLGRVMELLRFGDIIVYKIHWLRNVSDVANKVSEETLISLPLPDAGSYDNTNMLDVTVGENNIVSMDEALTTKSLMRRATETDYDKKVYALVDENNYEEYVDAVRAGRNLQKLMDRYPIYNDIITNNNGKSELKSIVDIIFDVDEDKRDKYITTFAYMSGVKAMHSVAEQVLDDANTKDGYELMTQEEQVEKFIEFSKLVASQDEEIVPDTMLDELKKSDAYKNVCDKIKEHGFGLSKTQQFNVLQSVGYLGQYRNDRKIIHNLSDMGSGKTMMTVEAIYLMDLLDAENFLGCGADEDYKDTASSLWVHNKNLVAPSLSIESSWVDTFKLFYDVEKVDDNQYKMSFEYKGVKFGALLNVSGFTVNNSGVSVTKGLPRPVSADEHLIIDEIHQLVARPITSRKFFAKDVEPAKDYVSFVLSGTLSNLTTEEWFHYIKFMHMKTGVSEIDSGSKLQTYIDSRMYKYFEEIETGMNEMGIAQHRKFDDVVIPRDGEVDPDGSKKETQEHKYFNLLYGAKLLPMMAHNGKTVEDNLLAKSYNVVVDNDILSVPNFELFYKLVGTSAITAESTQVAEELFGDQKKQHQADVITVPSSLDDTDIKLLKTLHNVTLDYNVYKSQAIATQINNAILNLNDGLTDKTIYDVVNKAASRNIKFLEYLSGLDTSVLELLPQSNLINKPELTETPKFKVLKDILAKESDETFLVVVNDFGAMKKLSDALGINSLTKAEVKDQINYQKVLDKMFEEQSIVVVPQNMIKSSLDLVAANRLVQYQLNTEISDIIQTQNRINRIGQTRETKAYYIATDNLQKNVIDLFLETYKNIRVAHKGIVELFVDMSTQVNVINDYIGKAVNSLGNDYEDVVEVQATENVEDSADVESSNSEVQELNNFEDNGQMDMFPETKKDVQTPAEDTTKVELPQGEIYVGKELVGQTDLFTPDEFASEHQLVLAAM